VGRFSACEWGVIRYEIQGVFVKFFTNYFNNLTP
jgi:hypothetical protein